MENNNHTIGFYTVYMEDKNFFINTFVTMAGSKREAMLKAQNEYINLPENIDKGVAILEVVKDSPAQSAGLQKGDVIYQINDEDVNSIAEFRYVLYKSRPGDTITLKYYRGADKKSVNVKLVKNDN